GDCLTKDLGGDVIAPGLVVRRITKLANELLGEGNGLRRTQAMVPETLPVAGDGIDASRPKGNRVHHPARQWKGETILLVLLEKCGLVNTGQADVDEVGLGVADLEDVGAIVGRIRRYQVVGENEAAVFLQEARRYAVQVVSERVVGREEIPLRAFDQVLLLLPG